MQRLKAHFKNAKCIEPQQRLMGIEIETLFLDCETRQPILQFQSQRILKNLANSGWEITQRKNGFIVQLEKDGFVILYELGCNNLELYTPPLPTNDIDVFLELEMKLATMHEAAFPADAVAVSKPWDEFRTNTLMIPDKRDEIWLELDGPVLYGLGHIASIQFNIDLCSIDEGMKWIRRLNQLYPKLGWPYAANLEIWDEYITGSYAKYETGRYGPAPDASFSEYVNKLAQYKMVMQKPNGDLEIQNPALPFIETENINNVELFLRSVWWYTRLRVRNGKLVLEIRDIPRNCNALGCWFTIRKALEF